MSEFEAHRLTLPQVTYYWPQIERELDLIPHTWDTYWTKTFLYEAAMTEMFEVWGAGTPDDLCLILFTQVVTYPANRILQAILMLGNSLEECAPALEAVLTRFAQTQHVTVLEVTGRPGWEKKLAPFGLKKRGIVMSKIVYEERVH